MAQDKHDNPIKAIILNSVHDKVDEVLSRFILESRDLHAHEPTTEHKLQLDCVEAVCQEILAHVRVADPQSAFKCDLDTLSSRPVFKRS